MDFDVQIAHAVSELGAETWDKLSGGQSFFSYRWYRYGETILADSLPVYIILRRQGTPAALATFWLTRQTPWPISSRLARQLTEILQQRWPLLICRRPLADMSGLILPESPPERTAALEIINHVAMDFGRRHRAKFIVFDYLGKGDIQMGGWPPTVVPVALSEPGTRLHLIWPDFESYLRDLSPAARKDYRRHRNRAAELGVQISRHRTALATDEVLELIWNVERRYNTLRNMRARAMLENTGMVDAVWLKAEVDGQLAGCGLLLGDGGVRCLKLLGLDYRVRYVYFQLVYESIRYAIEDKMLFLVGGSGAYELKKNLGFYPEDNNYVAFTSASRFLVWLGRGLAKL